MQCKSARMNFTPKKENKFKYIEEGNGTPIIFLHGLMGGLSNFEKLISFFSENNLSFLMQDKAARAFMKEDSSLLTVAISFECAASFTRTRIDPTNGLDSSDGPTPWSFNFNVYQQNVNRRRPPGGNPGCGTQWESPSRL